MSTEDNNQEEGVNPEQSAGEGNEQESQEDKVVLSKEEHSKLNETIGSLKRELKDLKKPKEEPQKETPEKTKSDEDALLQRLDNLSLQQAGITHDEDKELARNTAKKWNSTIEEVLGDEDFKAKLQRQQDGRSNVEATSDVRGSSGGATSAKNTTAYWVAKGAPPKPTDVPDNKTRRKIVREMMKNAGTSGKVFYND